KREEATDERNWLEGEMDAIRAGERPHPAMMTAKERHEETVKMVRRLKWTKGFTDRHGTRAAFEAIRDKVGPQGGAVGFLSVLTLEERQELAAVVREEMKWAAMNQG